MLIFYKQIDLSDGFGVLKNTKSGRKIDNLQVSSPSGIALYKHYNENNLPIKCFNCGIEANYWVACNHKNDNVKPPVLELYCVYKNKFVMMTRDHIIPKSLGGLDDLENLRPACKKCNNKRGSQMSKLDIQFMQQHPHLYKDNTKVLE